MTNNARLTLRELAKMPIPQRYAKLYQEAIERAERAERERDEKAAELVELRQALGFYADGNNWPTSWAGNPRPAFAINDRGERARAALAGGRETELEVAATFNVAAQRLQEKLGRTPNVSEVVAAVRAERNPQEVCPTCGTDEGPFCSSGWHLSRNPPAPQEAE